MKLVNMSGEEINIDLDEQNNIHIDIRLSKQERTTFPKIIDFIEQEQGKSFLVTLEKDY